MGLRASWTPRVIEDPAAPLAGDILLTARRMAADGLIVGTVGNVSARAPDGFVITPTRTGYEAMSASDLVHVTGSGATYSSNTPSRERLLHAAIYAAREDVHAVVHTHSVYATAWSFLGIPLEPALEENVYYEIGTVRTSPPAAAGSSELADRAVDALQDSRAALIGQLDLQAGCVQASLVKDTHDRLDQRCILKLSRGDVHANCQRIVEALGVPPCDLPACFV